MVKRCLICCNCEYDYELVVTVKNKPNKKQEYFILNLESDTIVHNIDAENINEAKEKFEAFKDKYCECGCICSDIKITQNKRKKSAYSKIIKHINTYNKVEE